MTRATRARTLPRVASEAEEETLVEASVAVTLAGGAKSSDAPPQRTSMICVMRRQRVGLLQGRDTDTPVDRGNTAPSKSENRLPGSIFRCFRVFRIFRFFLLLLLLFFVCFRFLTAVVVSIMPSIFRSRHYRV